MYKSLSKLNSLPGETEIYCAHEYTQSNLEWASHVSPNNQEIKSRLAQVRDKREKNILTLPSTLTEERKTNLFLQANNYKEFGLLRHHKDSWRP